MTAVGKAWRQQFNIPPKPSDTAREDSEIRRLEALCSAKDTKIDLQAKEIREMKPLVSSLRATLHDAEYDLQARIAETVAKRTVELQGEVERGQAMIADLRAVIETHNAANGQELRNALTAERDEAVRLLRVARAAESAARQEAFETRQFLAAAHEIVAGFKSKLEELEYALGEKLPLHSRYYGS